MQYAYPYCIVLFVYRQRFFAMSASHGHSGRLAEPYDERLPRHVARSRRIPHRQILHPSAAIRNVHPRNIASRAFIFPAKSHR